MTGPVSRFNLGFMQVRTGNDHGVLGEDFTIFRPKRQVLRESYLGFIYTRRATRNSDIPDRHSIGGDFLLATSHLRGSKNVQFSGYYIKTPNGVTKGDNASWGGRIVYPNDRWAARTILKTLPKNFDPAVGFRSIDYREFLQRAKFAPRPKNSRLIRQAGAELYADLYWDEAGRWTERNWNYIFDVNLQSSDAASFTINPVYEHLEANFPIGGGITLAKGNEYHYTRYRFTFSSADRRKIAAQGTVDLGSFYSGHRRNLSTTLSLRPRRGFLAQLTGQFNRVELAEGNFSTKVIRALINTQFSPFISVSNNIQFDSLSRLLGWQSRFRWIVKPGNDIYFVWVENWQDSDDRFTTLDRNAAVKLMYTYRF